MTRFIDLIYCIDLGGTEYLACAPMIAYIRKGDIVCLNGKQDFCFVSCKATVEKDSDIYKFITKALGEPRKVTDKYYHEEIGGSENE